MSYSVGTSDAGKQKSEVNSVDLVAELLDDALATGHGAESEVEAQVRAAVRAAVELKSTVGRAHDHVKITVVGHAVEGHDPENGTESVTVTVAAVPRP